jgi:hypothetical protein
MLLFADKYIELCNLKKNEPLDEEAIILAARAEVGYDSRLLPANVIKRFKEEASEYCTFKILNSAQSIISQDDYNLAQKLNSITRESKYLTDIFEPHPNRIVLFQVPIYLEQGFARFKILLDCIVIDLEKKVITPYDFKTYGEYFPKNYWDYKYYYQEALYGYVLDVLKIENNYITAEMPEELKLISTGYTINQFKFIAIDKTLNRGIEVYESYSKIIEDVIFNGIINKGTTNVRIKAISELIKEFNWRVHEDDWVTDYEMATKGVKKLWL